MSVQHIHQRYWIETYGCQMNSAESYALEQALIESGMTQAQSPEEADCAILNTCSVRKSAENRIWGRIGFYQHLKESRPITLVVTGCMAERLADDFLQEAPAVDHVVGTNDKQRIAALLRGGSDERDEVYSFTQSYHKPGDVSSYVPIMNGCNNFCAYCIVPYVRGREISRSPQSIYDEIDRLEQLGVREITLLGQNVNSYTYTQGDHTLRFPELLYNITKRLSSIIWVRFESPHPKDFSDELVALIGQEPKIAKNLHIPLQSGSNEILKKMNRKYTVERYLSLLESIKSVTDDVTFTSDLMVGFPGESEEHYQQTLQVVKDVRYLESFMYYFNPREGTKAYTMDHQLPSEVRMKRLQNLIALQRSISVEIKQQRVGRVETALIEGVSKRNEKQLLGRTEHNEMVVFEPNAPLEVGDVVSVQLKELVGNTYVAHQL